MSDVFYLRPIDPPAAPEAVQDMAKHAGGCFDLHRVDWRQSFLAKDGTRMLCWYRAPDAESARVALRELGSNMNAVWAGHVAADDARGFAATGEDCIVAEIAFGAPPGERALASAASSLPALARAFVSSSGTRLVCVCRTADEDDVRDALARAGAARETAAWPGIAITPRVGT